ncbi:uncharacterized protein [Penaeus vannamei]|uniref:Uncharacterized protein n=1 Tax=Penaeus vannamei TaxID=6689 RepID=A0A3R7P8Y5_PENVA|nr:serine/arginine repetitive matrix protein 1-like [Penaeus vannamei]ROT78821.1 hypothetical protein C7M84_002448 [Penaeus vannamei]
MSTRSSEQTAWPARVLRWRVIAGIAAPLVLLGGVGLNTFFILREDWNSVLASSLFFFSVFQLLYWYLRAKTLCSNRRQVRSGFVQPSESPREVLDEPPPYEEVIKTEAPPPAYYTVVSEAYTAVPSPVSRTFSTFSLPAASPSTSSEKSKGSKQALSSSCIPVHKASGRVSSAPRPTQPEGDVLATPGGRRAASQGREHTDSSSIHSEENNSTRQLTTVASSTPDPIRAALVRAQEAQSGARPGQPALRRSQRHLGQPSPAPPAPTHRQTHPGARA